jgi:hypothetical protein
VAESVRPTFLHAFQANGTISSICRRCLRTIASMPNEIDLGKLEDSHTCLDYSMRGMFYADMPKETLD